MTLRGRVLVILVAVLAVTTVIAGGIAFELARSQAFAREFADRTYASLQLAAQIDAATSLPDSSLNALNQHLRAMPALWAQGRSTMTTFGAALAAALMLLIASWVGVAIALHRLVIAPMRQLGVDLQLSARLGAHSHVIAATGPAEIAHAGRDAEALRRQLVAELDAARAATEAMHQNAPLATAWDAVMHPATTGRVHGLDIAGHAQAAEGVAAGDWWDVIELSPTRIALVLGDVAGHGVPAAMDALQARALVRAGVVDTGSPAHALELTARALGSDVYITVFVAVLDTEVDRLTFANAGHPRALLLLPGGDAHWLDHTGMAICPLADGWQDNTASFYPGSWLLLTSDGLLETVVADGRELGEAGLLEAVSRVPAPRAHGAAESIQDLLAQVRAQVHRWAADDITILTALRTGRVGDPPAAM